MCDIFEGSFPLDTTAEDGHVGTAPGRRVPANGFVLCNLAGDVWPWCGNWFSTDVHVDGPRVDPTGPSNGQAKVMRGGSYLCHDSYRYRYRVCARSSNTSDSSAGILGLRVASAPSAD